MEILLLRFDAPLMSFGGSAVDNYGVIRRFPALSMITGLVGNALGWHHRDGTRLGDLQSRIRFATRIDQPGTLVEDYQTVDLGQEFMVDTGWTTRGVREDKAGGEAKKMTHIRHRRFHADARATVALTLVPVDGVPTIEELEAALVSPERPLFLGRKPCLPSGPVWLGRTRSHSLVEALRAAPCDGEAAGIDLEAQWPATDPWTGNGRVEVVTDERDWENQIHGGERRVMRGMIRAVGNSGS